MRFPSIGERAFAENRLASQPNIGSASLGANAFANNLFRDTTVTGNQPQRQTQTMGGLSKLTGNLLGGLGLLGSFAVGEQVHVPQMFLSAIDLMTVGNELHYLVMVNDRQAHRMLPFYIISTRRLNLMNLQFQNTVSESLVIEFVRYGEFLQNRVPRRTYVFRVVN